MPFRPLNMLLNFASRKVRQVRQVYEIRNGMKPLRTLRTSRERNTPPRHQMMQFQPYKTPDGFDDLVMSSDGEVLTGLWFEGARDVCTLRGRGERRAEKTDEPSSNLPVFRETCRWLDIYFSGRNPDFTPSYRLLGATPFREAVSREMLKIPFGATVT